MQKEGKIIVAHQPFGPDGDWYGFSKKQIDELLEKEKQILTEIHPDNIPLFKKLYGSRVFAIALTSETEYLEYNLKSRNSENDIDRETRLNKAIDEIKMIEKLRRKKLIDKIVKVNWDNRDELAELITNEVEQKLRLPAKKEYKIKLK